MPHALLGIAAAAASSSSSVSQVAVYCSAGDTGAPSCSLSEGVLTTDATAAATAVSIYNKTYNATTGFATLDVNALVPDPRLAAFAAGFAEGYQTAFEVAQFWSNVYEFGEDGPSKALTKWVEENDKWTRARAEEHAASSDYWLSVQTVLDRFDGLHAGYEAAGRAHGVMRHRSAASASAPQQTLPALSRLDLLWINLDGDLFDLQVAIEGEEGVKLGRKGRAVRGFERAGALRDRLARTAAGNGTAVAAAETGPLLRCSALFKLAEDRRELYFGHATWDTYATAAPRIFKHLTLPTRQGDKARTPLPRTPLPCALNPSPWRW